MSAKSKRTKMKSTRPSVSLQIMDTIEHISDGVVIFDAQMNYTYVNERGGEMLGRKPTDLIGKNYWDEYPKAKGTSFANAYMRALEIQSFIKLEDYYEPFDRWFENRIYPSKEGLLILFQDITDRKKVEIALHEQSRFISALVDTTPALIYIYDLETQSNVYSNSGIEQLLGYTAETIKAMGAELFARLIHPDDLPKVLEFQTKIAAALDEEIFEFEYRMKHSNGEWFTLRSYERPFLRNPDGSLKQKIGIAIDVTERKKAEELTRESEANLKSLIDNREDYIWSLDRNFEYITFNKIYAQFYLELYKSELKKGMNATETLTPEEYEFWVPKYESVFAGEIISFELSYPLNGHLHYFRVSLNPIYTGDTITGASAINSDVTEYKQIEAALRESEAKFRSITENAVDYIFIKDKARRYIFVNPAMQYLLGLPKEKILGKTPLEIFGPEQAQIINDVDDRSFAGEVVNETRELLIGGNRLFFNTIQAPLFDVDGEAVSIMGIVRDVTESRQVEDDLQKRASELASLNALADEVSKNLSLDEVISAGLHGMLEAIRSDLAFFFLREDERLILKSVVPSNAKVRLEDIPEHRVGECMCGLAVREKKAIYSRNIFTDLRCTWNECKKAGMRSFAALPLISDGDVIGVIGLASDEERDFEAQAEFQETLTSTIAISLRNALLYEQAQQRLKELTSIHETAQQLQVLQTTETLSQTLIRILEKNLNYEYGAILLLDAQDKKLIPFALSEQGRNLEFVEMDKAYILSQRTQVGKGITGWVAQTGKSVRLGDVREDERYLPLRSEIRSELCVPLHIGDQIIGVINTETSKTNAYTELDQRVLETIAAQIVVAIQNARLLEQIQGQTAELEQRVKERTRELSTANKELESFTYSVSHDLRAPLRAISGFAEIIKVRHKLSLNEEGQHYFDNIVDASKRMGRLIDDLLSYSRLGRTSVQQNPVPLAGVLADIIKDMQDYLDELHGTITIPEGLPIVMGNRTILSQIFTNLLENAITYRKTDTPPQVEITHQIEGEQVIIKVCDNGIGIPAEHQEKIFAIFQRLHRDEEYPGTGIGLATVKKSVELLAGVVWVESKVEEGSRFFVKLPKE
ncbi:MAG: PAS domain S-box protein [Anaerolineae bacterium]|jgi:PAS domain S-box-containing protein|nr:PAS domain S-box protein [Anaerolineae bacterium]MBT7990301.1 PAS domain S-box protein [Anaerolineae bacterium]